MLLPVLHALHAVHTGVHMAGKALSITPTSIINMAAKEFKVRCHPSHLSLARARASRWIASFPADVDARRRYMRAGDLSRRWSHSS